MNQTSANKQNSKDMISTGKVIVVFKDRLPINPEDYKVIPKEDVVLKENEFVRVLSVLDNNVTRIAIVEEPVQQKVNLENIVNVVKGTSYYVMYKQSLLSKGLSEQFEKRMNDCKPCIDNGKCFLCGCKTPEKLFTEKGCPNSKPLKHDKDNEGSI
jgi:hypothetical protein